MSCRGSTLVSKYLEVFSVTSVSDCPPLNGILISIAVVW